MPAEEDLQFAALVLARKLAPKKSVETCLQTMNTLRNADPTLTLAQYLVSKKVLSQAAADKVLKEMPPPAAGKGATGRKRRPGGEGGGAQTSGFQICGICGKEQRPGQFLKNCESCGEGFHLECFLNNGGCSNGSCRPGGKRGQGGGKGGGKGAPAGERVIVDFAGAARRRKVLILAGAVVGCAALALAGWAAYEKFARSAANLLADAREQTGRKPGEALAAIFARKKGVPPPGATGAEEARDRAVRAQALLRKAEQKNPRDPEVLAELAAVEWELGGGARALELLGRISQAGGGSETAPSPAIASPAAADADLALGALAYEAGDFAQAEKDWKRAEAAGAEPARLRPALIELYETRLKRPEDALPYLRSACKEAPDDAALAVRMAAALAGKDFVADALAIVQRLKEAGTLPPDAAGSLLRILVEKKRTTEAAKLARTLLEAPALPPEVQRACGQALLAVGDGDGALLALKPLLAGDTRDFELLLAVGRALVEKGEAAEALPLLASAGEADPKSPEPALLEARARVDVGQAKEALAALARLPAGSADRPDVAPVVARVALEAGDSALAERALRAALARAPDDPELLGLEARRTRLAGDARAAADACRRALDRRKSAAGGGPLLRELGLAARALGRNAAALDALRGAVADGDVEASFELGVLYQALGARDQAVEAFGRFLAKVPHGTRAGQARAVAGGGAPSDAAGGSGGSPLAEKAATLRAVEAALAEPLGKDQDPLDAVTAGLTAVAFLSAVAAGEGEALAELGQRLEADLKKFKDGRPSWSDAADALRSQLCEQSVAENAARWATTTAELVTRFRAALGRRDKEGKTAPRLDAAVKDFLDAPAGALPVERGAEGLRALAGLLVTAVQLAGPSAAAKAELDARGVAAQVQQELCDNALQRFVGNTGAAAGALSVLLACRDTGGRYAAQRAAAAKDLAERDEKAAGVADQARVAMLQLVRLLQLAVREPDLLF
ncbi:MAG: tetratricopeptide repeat protein [Planctomycetes bacterium]|nr:tetratricopeptide repeat protein [Planctomycetota bacterium]